MIQISGLETYFGGKGASGTFQKIINHIPACDCYVSGFLGADFVLRNMNNLPGHIVGIDVDTRVTELWKKAGNNIRSNVMIRNGEFLRVFNEIYLQLILNPEKLPFKNPFIYLDPPYPHSTRSSNHRYTFEMTDSDHAELLTEVRQIKYNIAISTYDNDLYRDYLHDWYKIDFESKTQKGMRTETLYMNYDISRLQLQDNSYTGDNYRERDRIRQKCKRWKNRINRMPKEERDYLFHELSKFYTSIDPNICTPLQATSDPTLWAHGQQHQK